MATSLDGKPAGCDTHANSCTERPGVPVTAGLVGIRQSPHCVERSQIITESSLELNHERIAIDTRNSHHSLKGIAKLYTSQPSGIASGSCARQLGLQDSVRGLVREAAAFAAPADSDNAASQSVLGNKPRPSERRS